MSHTPGPWEVDSAHGTDAVYVLSENHLIAHVIAHGDGTDDAANARLIAAAPDLLEACQAALEIAEALHPRGSCDGCRMCPLELEMAPALRAALYALEAGR